MVDAMDFFIANNVAANRSRLIIDAVAREIRRLRAVNDAAILMANPDHDELDELVSWSVGQFGLADLDA
jgi:hypothetical protein